MREELWKEIEQRRPLPSDWEFERNYRSEQTQAIALVDIARSLRILTELMVEHLSEHGN